MKSITKVSLSILVLVSMIIVCVMMTLQLNVKAGEDTKNDYAQESRAAATYLNAASTKNGGGLYWPSTKTNSFWEAAGWIGYESDSNVYGENNYNLCQKSSANSVTYGKDRLNKVLIVTGEAPEMGAQNIATAAADSFSGTKKPANGYTDGSTGNQTVFSKYIDYGYKLSQLGFDEVAVGSGSAMRMVFGTVTLIVYALLAALGSIFDAVLDMLAFINPFHFLTATGENIDFSYTSNGTTYSSTARATTTAFDTIMATIRGYYSIFRNNIGLAVITICLAVGVSKFVFAKTQDGATLWRHLRTFTIRFVFLFLAVPVMFGVYDEVLGFADQGVNTGDGRDIIASTYIDFKTWVMSGKLQDYAGVASSTDDLTGKARSLCYQINNKATGTTATDDSFRVTLFGDISDTSNRIITHKQTVRMLQDYASGVKISPGEYMSTVEAKDLNRDTGMHELSSTWTGYNDKVASAVKSGDKAGVDGGTKELIDKRFATAPWAAPAKGFSDMGMFNYLSSEFTETGVTVYSSETSSNVSKPMHYAVNVVGGPVYAKVVNAIDAIVLMGVLVYIGFAFALAMFISGVKGLFQIIPAVFTGMVGSMKGIAQTCAIFLALIFNVIVTLLLYSMASALLTGFFALTSGVTGVLGSVATNLGLPTDVTSTAITALSIFILVKMCMKVVLYRTAIIKACTDAFTESVNRFFGTSVKSPNLAGGGGLKSAAAVAGGIGLAAANGAFDGLGERLGFGSSGSDSSSLVGDAAGGVSGTMADGSDLDSNPFGVTPPEDAESEVNGGPENISEGDTAEGGTTESTDASSSGGDTDTYSEANTDEYGGDNSAGDNIEGDDSAGDNIAGDDSAGDNIVAEGDEGGNEYAGDTGGDEYAGNAMTKDDMAMNYLDQQNLDNDDDIKSFFNGEGPVDTTNTGDNLTEQTEGNQISGSTNNGNQNTDAHTDSSAENVDKGLNNSTGITELDNKMEELGFNSTDPEMVESREAYTNALRDMVDNGKMDGSATPTAAAGSTGALATDKGSVEGSPMPDGSVGGIVTNDGQFVSNDTLAAMRDAQGATDIPTGAAAIQTSDGSVIEGTRTPDGGFIAGTHTDQGFVMGLKTDDGRTVPGRFNDDGQFMPGVQTENGFVPGVYEQDANGNIGFTPCVFDDKGIRHDGIVTNDGKFISSDSGAIKPMGKDGMPAMPSANTAVTVNKGNTNTKADTSAKTDVSNKSADISKTDANAYSQYAFNMSGDVPKQAPGMPTSAYESAMKTYNNSQAVKSSAAVHSAGYKGKSNTSEPKTPATVNARPDSTSSYGGNYSANTKASGYGSNSYNTNPSNTSARSTGASVVNAVNASIRNAALLRKTLDADKDPATAAASAVMMTRQNGTRATTASNRSQRNIKNNGKKQTKPKKGGSNSGSKKK